MSILPLKTHIKLQQCTVKTKNGFAVPIHHTQECGFERIYGVFGNYEGQVKRYYRRNATSRTYSVLRNIHNIKQGFNTIIQCDVPYVMIGDGLVSCRLIKLCNQLHFGDN